MDLKHCNNINIANIMPPTTEGVVSDAAIHASLRLSVSCP